MDYHGFPHLCIVNYDGLSLIMVHHGCLCLIMVENDQSRFTILNHGELESVDDGWDGNLSHPSKHILT